MDSSTKLLGLTLYLTNNCNLRCRHCWISAGTHSLYLDVKVAYQIIDDAYKEGVRNFLITGGEPTLHRNFVDVLDYIIKKDGTTVEIETNGVLLTEDLLSQISISPRINFNISLDGSRADIHDYIRRVDGCYEKAIKAIRIVSSRKQLRQLIMAVNRVNYEDIENVVLLCIREKISSLRILPVQKCGNAAQMELDNLLFSVSEQIEFYDHVQQFQKNYSTYLYIDAPIPPAFMRLENLTSYSNECSFCNRLSVLADQTYTFCGFGEIDKYYVLGDCKEYSIKDIRNTSKYNKCISELDGALLKEPCNCCIYSGICQGFCKAASLQFNPNFKENYLFCEEAFKEGLFPKNVLRCKE